MLHGSANMEYIQEGDKGLIAAPRLFTKHVHRCWWNIAYVYDVCKCSSWCYNIVIFENRNIIVVSVLQVNKRHTWHTHGDDAVCERMYTCSLSERGLGNGLVQPLDHVHNWYRYRVSTMHNRMPPRSCS